MAKRTPKKVVSIAVDPALWDRVEELADAQGVSRSAFLVRLLRDAIDQEEDTIKALQNPVIASAMIKAFGDRNVVKAVAQIMNQELTPAQIDTYRTGMEHLAAMPKVVEKKSSRKRRTKKGTKA